MNYENIEQSKGFEKKLYTGIMPVQVEKVNPTISELAKMYGKEEGEVREPVYVGDESTRLDFYYKAHPSIDITYNSKFSIFISKKLREFDDNGTTLKEYLDDYGRRAWARDLDHLNEVNATKKLPLDLKTVRQAKVGESMLYGFLRAYCSAKADSPVKLDSFEDLVKGKVKELKEFFTHFNDSQFMGGYGMGAKVLLGIKDGKYQDVYTKVFLRVSDKNFDYLEKQAKGEQSGFKSFWGSTTLREFEPVEAPANSTDSPFEEGGVQAELF